MADPAARGSENPPAEFPRLPVPLEHIVVHLPSLSMRYGRLEPGVSLAFLMHIGRSSYGIFYMASCVRKELDQNGAVGRDNTLSCVAFACSCLSTVMFATAYYLCFLSLSVPNGYDVHFAATRERGGRGERFPDFEQGHFMICVQTGLAKNSLAPFSPVNKKSKGQETARETGSSRTS